MTGFYPKTRHNYVSSFHLEQCHSPGVDGLHPLHPPAVPVLCFDLTVPAVSLQPLTILAQPASQLAVLVALGQAPGSLGYGGRPQVLKTDLAEVPECLGEVGLNTLHDGQQYVQELLVLILRRGQS